MNFLKLITSDLKKNYKIFIFFLIFFTLIFYIAAYANKQKNFNYYSSLLVIHPQSKVKWVEFDKEKYIAGLFFLFAKRDIESNVSKICNIKNLKLISDFKKTIENLSFIEIEFYHKEKAAEDCINKIFNEIIIKNFNEYLDELALVHKGYLNLLEIEQRSASYETLVNLNKYLSTKNLDIEEIEVQKRLLLYFLEQNKENGRISSMIKLSSLKSSYHKPRIFKKKLNSIYKESDINHSKIILSSLIFTSILTLLAGSLFNRIRQKI